jgi:hypothetical protein
MGAILRVLSGFILANLAAALTLALFVYTPSELATAASGAAGDPWSGLGAAWLVAFTQNTIFSALPALLAVALGEWRHVREWSYYALAGIVIAMLGFAAQWLSESTGQNWSVVDSNYPFVAFLTTGFVGGFTYWMWSGRLAGAPARPASVPDPAPDASAKKT